MSGKRVAIDMLRGLLRASDDFAELIESMTGADRRTLDQRLARAKASIKDPIDTSPADDARRAELDRILKGRS